ncbi:hypothetical protein KIN20_026073 [Parelaphostrongylus tenuis]|uniref:Uncharacterized protein n=1 Tax=Parelaphostrongylus tenuis TaxID=148309 RepID=A0AAD5MW73_PARTN|nr:hypothetical protein KIN20_026073 [Parelaphostrongylus tenuis]
MPRVRRKGRAAKAARRGQIGVAQAGPRRRHKRTRKNEDALDEQERAIKQIRAACAAKTAEVEKARQPHSFVISSR